MNVFKMKFKTYLLLRPGFLHFTQKKKLAIKEMARQMPKMMIFVSGHSHFGHVASA